MIGGLGAGFRDELSLELGWIVKSAAPLVCTAKRVESFRKITRIVKITNGMEWPWRCTIDRGLVSTELLTRGCVIGWRLVSTGIVNCCDCKNY